MCEALKRFQDERFHPNTMYILLCDIFHPRTLIKTDGVGWNSFKINIGTVMLSHEIFRRGIAVDLMFQPDA